MLPTWVLTRMGRHASFNSFWDATATGGRSRIIAMWLSIPFGMLRRVSWTPLAYNILNSFNSFWDATPPMSHQVYLMVLLSIPFGMLQLCLRTQDKAPFYLSIPFGMLHRLEAACLKACINVFQFLLGCYPWRRS